MKTGNTRHTLPVRQRRRRASMEPGHEDREYLTRPGHRPGKQLASMEPGHEDREYVFQPLCEQTEGRASMEPGHEDREYAGASSERKQNV